MSVYARENLFSLGLGQLRDCHYSALIPTRSIGQMLPGKFFWSWILESSGKEKKSRCLVPTFSTKREIRHFHVVVVQRRRRNVQKNVMHVQSYCFANGSKPIAFFPFSLPSPSLLKLPNESMQYTWCRSIALFYYKIVFKRPKAELVASQTF